MTTEYAIVYLSQRAGAEPARFGFVVAKTVGGAVQRNQLRRRLRAIGRELVDAGYCGADIVVRALPGSASLAWGELRDEIAAAVERGGSR